MKSLILVIVFLVFNLNVSALTYYVAANGNDANSGQSTTTPWKTIDKVNSKMTSFTAGDIILFRKGDTFFGTLLISISGTSTNYITFGAYGTGNLPVLAAYKTLTNWTPLAGYPNVWESTYTWTQDKIASLLVNNEIYAMGRYPNLDQEQGGYLIYDSFVGKTQIQDNELSTAINWTGAEAVIRVKRWVLERSKILSHDVPNRKLNIDASQISVNIENKNGYFIQNHLKTLDRNFEWAYNPTSKKVYLYSATSPNQLSVKISNLNNLIKLNSAKYILFEDLHLQASNEELLLIDNGLGVKIRDCKFDFAGTDAIKLTGNTKNSVIENNQIQDANNMGIFVSYVAEYNLINKNILKNIGYISGLGESGGEAYTAIYVGGANNTVQFNDVDNVGYNGIAFFAKNSIIQNNFVKNTCLVKNDGGGIYMHTEVFAGLPGCKILNNIVLYVYANPNGTTTPTLPLGGGIYVDGFSAGIEIKNNTIAFANCKGIFLHNSINMNIANNVFYANKSQMAYVNDGTGDGRPMVGNLVNNNIFASTDKEQFITVYDLLKDDIDNMGNRHDNYFLNPFSNYQNTSYSYDKVFPNLSTSITEQLVLNQQKARYNIEQNSKSQPISYPTYLVNGLTSVNYVKNPTFESNANNWSSYGSAMNGASLSSIAKVQRVTNSPMGNALLLSFNSFSGQNHKMGAYFRTETAVTQGAKYLLKFDVASSGNKQSMEVVFRKHGTSYDNLAKIVQIPLNTATKRHEILFECNSSSLDARIDFIVEEQDSLAWIDNVEFYKVDATYTNDSQEQMKLFYNPSSTTKTQVLDGTYLDKNGIVLGSSIAIPPYSSVVVFKALTSTLTSPNFWLETECATQIGVNWEKKIDTQASGGGKIVSKTGYNFTSTAPTDAANWVKFDIDLTQAGNYKIHARLKAANSTNDSFWVKMDNGTWTNWSEGLINTNFTWKKAPINFDLGKGLHTLYFAIRESQLELDKVFITSKDTTLTQDFGGVDATCCPIAGTPCDDNNPLTINDVADGDCGCAGLPIGDTWLEAECPTVLGNFWEVKSDNNASNASYISPKAGYTNLSAPISASGVITYNFTVAENKNYDIWARIYALNSTDDSFWIKADNQTWIPWYTTINSAYTWQKLPLGTLNLQAGSHTISFGNREDGVRLDKIVISSSPSTAPTAMGNASFNCTNPQTISARMVVVEEPIIEESALGIKVSPNPVQDFVKINFATKQTDKPANNELRLYNISGVLVKKWTNLEYKGTIDVNLENLSHGMYILKMITNGEAYQTKIIKL